MRSKLVLLAAAGFTLVAATVTIAQDTPVVVDPAIESMSVDQLVSARQDAMKQNGSVLRSAMRASGDEAVKSATVLLQSFANMPALFREGSVNGASDALPAIWENWDDFKGRLDASAAAAQRALDAAKSGDATTYATAMQEIGQSCGGCHQAYRD